MSTIDEMLAIVNAAKSVPELESKLKETASDRDHLNEVVYERNITISKLQQISNDLEAKLRSLEVERDNYGFRLLDAEDKLAKLGSILGVGAATDVKVSEASVKGISPQTTSSVDQPLSDSLAEAEGPITGDTVMEDNTTGGQGTASPIVGPTGIESETVPTPIAKPMTNVGGIADDKPYTDRNYWDKPSDMTWRVWHRHGGPLPHWLNVNFHDLDSTN